MKMFFAAILTFILGGTMIWDVVNWKDFLGIVEEMKIEWTKEANAYGGKIPDPGYEVKMLEPMPPQFAMMVLMDELTPEQKKLMNDKSSMYGRNILEMRLIVARLNIIIHEFKTNAYSRENVVLQVEYDQLCEEVARHWRTLKQHTNVMPKTFRDYLRYHKSYPVICHKIN